MTFTHNTKLLNDWKRLLLIVMKTLILFVDHATYHQGYGNTGYGVQGKRKGTVPIYSLMYFKMERWQA